MAKVLYVTESIAPYVIGGMQTVARRHIQYLKDDGHDVIVLHSRVPFGALGHINDPALNLLPWPGENRKWRYPGQYALELRKYSQEVLKWVSRVSPDVVYAEGPVVDALFSLSERPPIIFHPHGLEVYQQYSSWGDFIRLFLLKQLIKKHCRQADYAISQGGQLTRILVKRAGVPKSRIRFVPNTFDEYISEPNTKSTELSLLFVGRGEKRKGLSLLLDVAPDFPELRFDVAGSHLIPTGLPKNVRVHGMINDKDKLTGLYRKAHFFVLPTLAEGMPTVILEAMSQGTPVIASDVGAIAELVINGETGWCIGAGSKSELRRAISEALSMRKQEYQKMSQNCVKLLKEKFSGKVVRAKLNNLIKEAALTSCIH
ncbi:MAG: glycosyltransferase family 1 protein [Candidatus Electrothrix sp. ATG1]|nr:glycosyltransferase family 1 protein [Candidatus Electrothrix sp. ATG1]